MHDRSFFLFITFYGFATYIMLDMFIAVVLDNFTYWYEESNVDGGHTREDFRTYVSAHYGSLGQTRSRAIPQPLSLLPSSSTSRPLVSNSA